MKQRILLLSVLCALAFGAWAQQRPALKGHAPLGALSGTPRSKAPQGPAHAPGDRCGFEASNKLDSPARKAWLEAWEKALQRRMAERRGQRTEEVVYTIPVVVHVIHNGEPVGEGANISAEQVYSQFEVLNEDFRALNADLSKVRNPFQPLIGDVMVQFAPALEDPEGNPLAEPGIHRVQGAQTLWDIESFDAQAKPSTQYDPYRYANFWTANLGGGLLGYAQFPLDPVVPGLPAGSDSEIPTDGVVIGYQNFGSIDKVDTPQLEDGAPYNLGRTATHEVGHWLGLFHIWGDGGCSVDDRVDDTPPQGASNSGCPAADHTSCDNLDMWENYMDYTDDRCMYLFTQGQADRMQAVLDLDAMRQALTQSDVPMLGANSFTVSSVQACMGQAISLQASLANGYTLVGWEFPGGQPAASTDPAPSVVYAQAGRYDVLMRIRNAEGEEETVLREDYLKVVSLAGAPQLPVSQGFESGIPANWEHEGDGWRLASVGASGSARSAFMPNRANNFRSQLQTLATFPISLAGQQDGLEISFDVAYAYYQNGNTVIYDELRVGYLEPCTGKFVELWRAVGPDLATAPSRSSAFVPNASQWRRESVYLPNVAGVGHLQAAFIGVGRNGNNLYLDNIAVRPAVGVLPAFDAGVRKVCPGQSIQFINKSQIFGNPGPVSWSWTFEGGSPGSSTAESPAGISFAQPGRYDVTLSGTVGGVTYTTTLEDFVTVLDIAELAPTFSESFDQAGVLDTDEWLASPRNAWVEVALGTLPGGASVAVDHYNNDYSTTELRLLTPNIGFHGLENAYLQFDVAYSGWISPNGTTLIYDDLELLYSTDCGATFTSFRTFLGAELATAAATSQLFVPTSSQWRTISVPLYGVNASGQLEGLRFAIRPLGGYGNVLWLDNVVAEAFGSEAPVADFFTSAYPQPADVGTVLVNQPVQFVERSRYFPQFWTWSFEGGSPSVSNERNPSVVFAEPGTYNVSLTVSSPFGVGVATRSAYVVVASPSGGQSTELDNGTDGVESVDASDEYGYVSGHNNYEDAAVAEYFADPSPFAEMTEAKFWFLEALAGNRQPVQVRVWANDAGKPGAVLASETIPFASVQASATGGTPVRVPFSQPVQVAGGFFVGILLNYSAGGDQVALRTDEVEENTAWTLYSDNTWHEFSETGNWDISRSLWIFPTVRVATVTALEDEPLSQGLVLYPNPTGGLVSWKAVPGAVATGYEVLDLVGRRVAAGTPTLEGGLQQADLGGLPSGVYLLRLETPQGQALKKVVLSR